MVFKNSSKLQIRAEVLLILRNIDTIDEMSKDQLDKCLYKLSLIKDKDYVLEILAKELSRTDFKKGQIISYFLQELGDLEKLQDVLWSYIKSPTVSDEIKDLAGITLKNLGDKTDPEEFLTYLKNPKAIVDKETQKLLEVASVNPEAQIDFLDFLFSLPESEQINLIQSLKNDYSSEHLVNVVAPALEAKPSIKLQEELIKILGETRSALAIPVLTDIAEYTKEDILKKQAQKSLKMLKIAGITQQAPKNYAFQTAITKVSDIYECHTNIVDGVGNQGIIIGRIKPNQDILMMNVIVNDIHGIIDCFGFYGISKHDFARIIDKFQEKTTRFFTSAEYCKYKLVQAEKINKENNLPIPYEYAAWKSILSDIDPLEADFEKNSENWHSEKLVKETSHLFKFPDFEHWFFEGEDHPELQNTIEELITEAEQTCTELLTNESKIIDWIESKISIIFDRIFDEDVKQIYQKRLLDLSYLLDFQELVSFRDFTASLAWSLKPEQNCELNKIPFFREIIKRTIKQNFLRYRFNIEQKQEQKLNVSRWNIKKKQNTETPIITLDKDFEKFIDILSNI